MGRSPLAKQAFDMREVAGAPRFCTAEQRDATRSRILNPPHRGCNPKAGPPGEQNERFATGEIPVGRNRSTWLVPHRGLVPSWISGIHDSVAIRVSGHAGMRRLCSAWGGPLVSTSANPAGSQAPKERFQVVRYFGNQLDAMLPGQVGGNPRPSVIRDLITDQIVRA